MRILYKPKGRAGEYGELALNLYTGCLHGCKYCYVPSILRKTPQEFHSNVVVRKNVHENLRLDMRKAHAPIFLSFTCDPYQPGTRTTRDAIRIIKEHGGTVIILTKGGQRALRDFDMLTGEDKVGATLTFTNIEDSLRWEPRAAPPYDRMLMLKRAHLQGIRTWVSLEPIIDPDQTLELIDRTAGYVDEYKVGKLNHFPIEIDWYDVRDRIVNKLEALRLKYYIKKDLQGSSQMRLDMGPKEAP